MMKPLIGSQPPLHFQIASQLRLAIETRQPDMNVAQITQDLIRSLGGTCDLRELTPGSAAIYLLSLMLTQPPK